MKILISDIDKTLYFGKEKEKIKTADLHKIKSFQSHGHLFGVCTGRAYSGVKKITDLYDLKLDFMILSSGAIIMDDKGDYIKQITLRHKDVKAMISLIKSYVIEISMTCHETFYYSGTTTHSGGKNVIKFTDFNEVNETFFTSFALQFDHSEKLIRAKEILEKYFDKIITIHRNENNLDIAPIGCSKGNAIKEIQTIYPVTHDQIFVIGDSYNDIPMFEAINNSFTFYSSPPEIQSKAKSFVHSVAECIDRIL